MKIWELFSGLDRAYGTYQVQELDGSKFTGSARTFQQPVTQDIWDLHLSGERSLGIIPIRDNNTCVFAAIDIDTYPLDHNVIESKIKDLGLPLLVCRSKSGGAHLYLFIKPPGALAASIRPKLAEWAAELGYAGVEIFPKQDELRNKEDVGNWINMPYFGSDKDELRYAIVNGKRASLAKFIKEAFTRSISHDELDKLQVDSPDDTLLEGGPPCLNTLMRSGFPAGTRNISLFNLGVFARKRWPDEWQDKIDELNDQLLDPPLSIGEVTQIKRNLEKKTYFYKCSDSPINSVCQRDLCSGRQYGIGGDGVDLGFKLEGSIRILTEEVYYITTISGKRVYLNAHAICGMHAFRIAVMQQTGIMVPNMKARQFGELMGNMTKEAQEVEAPQYSGKRGSLFQEVLQIVATHNTAESWKQCMSGLPLLDDKGGVYLFPHQLVKTLKRRLQVPGLLPETLFETLIGEDVKISEKKRGGYIFWYLQDLALYKEMEEDEEL